VARGSVLSTRTRVVVVIVVVVVVVVVLVAVLVMVVVTVGVLLVLCGRGWCGWWCGCMVTDGSEGPLGIVRSAQRASTTKCQAHVSKHVA
jgi:hypothetical protein